MRTAPTPLLVLVLLAAACGAGDPPPPPTVSGPDEALPPPAPIPAKTVVLTFDDAVRNHLEFVAPRLAKRGFGATFFVTAEWMDDPDAYLTWEDCATLHGMGFEVGNHGWLNMSFASRGDAKVLRGQIERVEAALARVGVPAPVSFAWPGNDFGPGPRDVLDEAGYEFARRGMQPEFAYGETLVGKAYDPRVNDHLLIPTTGDANRDWDATHFRKLLAEARPGRAVVLQFHGVPDPANELLSTSPAKFREYLDILEEGDYRVVALRDLKRHGVLEVPSDDPMMGLRYPPVRRER